MRITRLQLRNVRRHADLDLELAPGLTVVRGPNESGKSTLQRAIELALTRRVSASSIARWIVDLPDSFGPRTTVSPGASSRSRSAWRRTLRSCRRVILTA